MSPLFALIVLASGVGFILLVVGLITRKKTLILIGVPASALLLAWFVAASIPPNAANEFDRIFGAVNRNVVTDIDMIKPIMMDGYFISFRIPKVDFDQRIRPQLKPVEFTNFHLLRGQDLPPGWPDAIEDAVSALHKKTDNNEILVCYDEATESAYASVQFDRW